MTRRGRRGNGHARHAQAAAADLPEDDVDENIVVLDEEGNEVDDDQPLARREDVVEGKDDALDQENDEFAVLQRQFEELKAQKAADSARLRDYEQKNASQAQDVQASHKALIEHAILTAKGELNAAKSAFKDAMASGDYDAAGEAQAAIAAAQLDTRQYELAKDEFDRQAEATKAQPQRRAPANREEEIESYMNQFTPVTKAWATKHKDDLFKSPARTNEAVALHHAAVNRGIAPDTPEYFSYLERGLGIESAKAKPQRTQQEKRPPMASAPVSRGGAGGGRVEVQLTAAQRDMAARMGMTSQKYAKYYDDIQKNQNNPNWRGPRFSTADGQPKA